MPTLNKSYSLTITPEQFLEACSRNELIELQLLLDGNRFQKIINDVPEEVPRKYLKFSDTELGKQMRNKS